LWRYFCAFFAAILCWKMPRGAGVIATHDYYDPSDKVTCLAAYFVLERVHGEGERHSFPLEGREGGESAQQCAARALHEELHLRGLPAAALCQPAFAHIELPAAHLFVALQPGAAQHAGGECGTYSRAQFLARRAALQRAKAQGAAGLGCHLETLALAHVSVASLLADGAGVIRPRDHAGAPVRLRAFCYAALQDARVQAALREALANFYRRRPHLAPQAAHGAAQQPQPQQHSHHVLQQPQHPAAHGGAHHASQAQHTGQAEGAGWPCALA
jgi:hypothetical protein